jgi:predicted nucleotidyltransferase
MTQETLVKIVLQFYPYIQGIYLFGSYETEDEWPDSDVDIALLFMPEQAKKENTLALSPCRFALEEFLKKDVDLVNIRQVSTVFQKEIIFFSRILYCADRNALDEFEMLVMSFYQKLNEERRGILEEFYKTKRAYAV